MPSRIIRALDVNATNTRDDILSKSQLILKHMHDSAVAFLRAFDDLRGVGATTDEQQDLLRAMLTFSLAGLDSLIKQIVRDTLPNLINLDKKVKEGAETFLHRKLRDNSQDSNEISFNNKFLAKILLAESLKEQIIHEYICEITGKSLQSSEELMKVIYALGLEPSNVEIEQTELKPIFEKRNKIIHEFDIAFDAPRRNRIIRKRSPMVEDTNKILKISEKIFLKISEKINT
jgi:hypothetical protein